ncbi:MAG: hypothetical protein A2283_02950 [Lentisphaerae bacterium RIFOXYA12_FULL_48_11]|nr:MAG: hypothetical protein A2283_02950 [Lentisphaerae bacterium RIFOXYA12_FULL_48_11]
MNIEGFDNLEQIGEGGMAVVWKAHQVSLERDVAIKILKAELSADPEEVADFTREAKAAASLKHPNIIQVYDAAEQEGVYYFVMEYIAGQTAEQVLENGPLHWKKVAQIGLAIAEALDYAWNKASLIHRDVKPSNIMFDDDGTIKLADLGLAKRLDTDSLAEQIQIRKLEGTPNYMSPEQARCKSKLDFRSDMYSLGATMYHMVTGKLPFEEYETMEVLDQHTKGHLPNPRDMLPLIPPGICQLISRLMMKDADDRYADWTEVIKELKKVIAGRILVTKQGKQADSTVSLQKKKASDELVGKTKKVVKIPTPVWIRIPAWSILTLFWGYIIISICNLPPVPSLPKPVSTEVRKPAIVATTPVIKASVIAHKNGQTDVKKTEPEPQKNNDQPKPASDGMKASDEEQLLLHSLKSKLADSIINQNYNDALTYITQERQYSHSPNFEAEISKMEEYVNTLSGKGNALEIEMKKRIGQETVIRIKGVEWPMIIRSIEDGSMKVDLKSKIGSEIKLRPGVLTFAQLDPAECIRLLGSPDTETKCITIFALSFKAKDYKTALKAAERCGPFSDAFKARIELETGQSPQQ